QVSFPKPYGVFHDHYIDVGAILFLYKIEDTTDLFVSYFKVGGIRKRGINSSEKALLRHLIKEGVSTEIVFLANGIVLVVMTFGTFESHRKKGLAKGIGAVGDIF